jgi:hypothetical protein
MSGTVRVLTKERCLKHLRGRHIELRRYVKLVEGDMGRIFRHLGNINCGI